MSLANFLEIKRENISFIDEHGFKRPLPPPGYIEFDYHNNCCPNCKTFQQGVVGLPNKEMFVDKNAQKFYEENCLDEEREHAGYDDFCKEFEGEMIKSHWSRFGTEECMTCRCKYWSDFVSGYEEKNRRYVNSKWYYLPITVDWNKVKLKFMNSFIDRIGSSDFNDEKEDNNNYDLSVAFNWIKSSYDFWKNKKDPPRWSYHTVGLELGIAIIDKTGNIDVAPNFSTEEFCRKFPSVLSTPSASAETAEAPGFHHPTKAMIHEKLETYRNYNHKCD